MKKKQIDIVVPLYNEAEGLPPLYRCLCELAEAEGNYDFRFLFVNDGSVDGSLATLLSFGSRDSRVAIIDLSRNFGHHKAISAGLTYVEGDCAIVMDADLEDNPRHISRFLAKWSEGWEVVYALRGKRHVSWLKGILFRVFHRLNQKFSGVSVESTGSFALLDSKVIGIINQLPERNRYIPGLRSWVGFRQMGILLDRNPRYDGRPRVGTMALIRLAFDSLVGFSTFPLQLASVAGMLCAFGSFLGMLTILVLKSFLGITLNPRGWASMVMIMLFMGGVQLICLGVMGEYIGRILEEIKGRPAYIVRTVYGMRRKEAQVEEKDLVLAGE